MYTLLKVLILESTGVKLVVLTSLGSWADNMHARHTLEKERKNYC